MKYFLILGCLSNDSIGYLFRLSSGEDNFRVLLLDTNHDKHFSNTEIETHYDEQMISVYNYLTDETVLLCSYY